MLDNFSFDNLTQDLIQASKHLIEANGQNLNVGDLKGITVRFLEFNIPENPKEFEEKAKKDKTFSYGLSTESIRNLKDTLRKEEVINLYQKWIEQGDLSKVQSFYDAIFSKIKNSENWKAFTKDLPQKEQLEKIVAHSMLFQINGAFYKEKLLKNAFDPQKSELFKEQTKMLMKMSANYMNGLNPLIELKIEAMNKIFAITTGMGIKFEESKDVSKTIKEVKKELTTAINQLKNNPYFIASNQKIAFKDEEKDRITNSFKNTNQGEQLAKLQINNLQMTNWELIYQTINELKGNDKITISLGKKKGEFEKEVDTILKDVKKNIPDESNIRKVGIFRSPKLTDYEKSQDYKQSLSDYDNSEENKQSPTRPKRADAKANEEELGLPRNKA